MRDPDGRLRFDGSAAIRELAHPGVETAFLKHGVARELERDGRLVPFEWRTPQCLVSPRYPFVTQPSDWCDAQLLAAARLTIEVAEAALGAGFELKDASAWNVVFDGTRPVFCDHLSFQPLAARQWWAFGQFCRHFTFPLAAARLRAVHACETFRVHRDGLAPEQARALLGARGLASRLLPLLLGAGRKGDDVASIAEPAATLRPDQVLHARLLDYARRSLYPPKRTSTPATWSRYVDERRHYSETASREKLRKVREWLHVLRADCVLDLGCNTGEFSAAALDEGARVIAVDADHDSVQRLFEGAGGSVRLHPIVANIADLDGGRGWNAQEHPGLAQRLAGQADVALMLALTHHLHFSESIPLAEIAAFAAAVTTSHLVLELLPESDPMVQHLARQRRRATTDFTRDLQLDRFTRHFDLVELHPLPQSGRELALLRRRP